MSMSDRAAMASQGAVRGDDDHRVRKRRRRPAGARRMRRWRARHMDAEARPGPIWRDVRPADIATLANAGLGLAAIAAAAAGDPVLAYHLIFLGIIVDGIDGALARLPGGSGPLGHIIDTLADVVTFVTAPAAILLMAHGVTPWTVAGATAFMAAGLLRLARFQSLPGRVPHFFGLSTPGGAVVMATAAIVFVQWQVAVGAAILAAVAMLMRWPVPKLRGKLGVAAALVITTNLVLYFSGHAWHTYGLSLQLAFLIVYFVAGPAYLKARSGAA